MRGLLQRSSPREAEDVGGRSVIVTASDDSVDRYGDIVSQDGTVGAKRVGDGWVTSNFEKNPTVLVGHDYTSLPVGQVTRLWGDKVGDRKRLRAEVKFSASNPVADTVLGLFRDGSMRTVSVGFRSLAQYQPSDSERREWQMPSYGIVHASSELLEISAVPVPGNANALADGERHALSLLAAVAARSGHNGLAVHVRSLLAPRHDPLVERFEASMRRALTGARSGSHDLAQGIRQVFRSALAGEGASLSAHARRISDLADHIERLGNRLRH